MKILLLGDPSSPHVIKWANGINSKGIDVMVFGISAFDPTQFNPGINVEIFKIPEYIRLHKDGNLIKSIYILSLQKLKKRIKQYKCDILNAHSVSSYGLLGAFSGFHPYFISVWGSDILIFPNKSIFHRKLIKYSLSQADEIFATSKALKEETQKLSEKKINIINFGIDTEQFKPTEVPSLFNDNSLVIGTVKSMDYNYGIEYLLEAFSLIVKKYPSVPLKLLLVGGGGFLNKLKDDAKSLRIFDKTHFTGRIPFSEVYKYHNMIDIEVFPSISESFGVSVLEASACEKPVIVSDIGGLPEVVEENKTGFIFTSRNVDELFKKIEILLLNKELRINFGKAGRKRVLQYFNWEKNLEEMISFYEENYIPNHVITYK